MANRTFGLLGIAQALVDVLVDVSDAELAALGMKKGSYAELTSAEHHTLLERLTSHKQTLISGGSVSNSVAAFAALGGSAGIMCRRADDRFGKHFAADCEKVGLAMPLPVVIGGHNGICISMVSPDGERTMRTHLGAAKTLTKALLPEISFAGVKWVLLEGYVLANGESAPELFFEAIERARAEGAQIAFSCSDTWVVHAFGAVVDRLVRTVDLVFANSQEAQAVTGATTTDAAFEALCSRARGVVMSLGNQGVRVRLEGETWAVPAFSCEPRDLTGAGDMLAGAFLFGLQQGLSIPHAARAGCFMARAIIQQMGARLQGDATSLWGQAIAQPVEAAAIELQAELTLA